MKKIFVAALLAVSAIALSQQEASAWINSRIGIGMNWDWQSGGNSLLWGAWRDGQPGGEAFGTPRCPRPAAGPSHGFPQPTGAPAPAGFHPVPPGFGPVPTGSMPRQQMYPGSPYGTANYARPIYYYPNPYQR